jgi:hypothetical protein
MNTSGDKARNAFQISTLLASNSTASGLNTTNIVITGPRSTPDAVQNITDRFLNYAKALNGKQLSVSHVISDNNTISTVALSYGFADVSDATYVCQRADKPAMVNSASYTLTKVCNALP